MAAQSEFETIRRLERSSDRMFIGLAGVYVALLCLLGAVVDSPMSVLLHRQLLSL